MRKGRPTAPLFPVIFYSAFLSMWENNKNSALCSVQILQDSFPYKHQKDAGCQ